MRKRLIFASKIIVWATVGLSAAVLLFWLLVGGYWTWKHSGEGFWTVMIGGVLVEGAILICGFFHFVPLYGVDLFLWFGVRGVLNIEERRGFWLTLCGFWVLVSAGVIAWYVREAILLLGLIFA